MRETLAAARRRPAIVGFAALGALMHAAGHSFLAAAAGVLARALGGGRPMVLGSTDDRVVLAVAAGGVVAALLKLVGGAAAASAEARLAGEVATRVRLGVLDDLLGRRPEVWHGDRGAPAQDRLAALTTHIHEVERGVAGGVLGEIRAGIVLVPLVALLVALAPRLAGSAALALLGFGVFAFSLRRAFKRAHDRSMRSASSLVAAADEAVKHADLWSTYGAQRRIRDHLARASRRIVDEAVHLRVRASVLSSTSEVLGAFALVLVLLLAARGALGVDRASVVPFAIAFFMVYRPLRDLVDAKLSKQRGEAALNAAFSSVHVNVPASVPERTEKTESPRWVLADLQLRALRPLHGTAEPVSITVPAGHVVAIVGPTGIGKTSLLRTLLGLEPARDGHVHYGNVALDRAGVGPAERPFAWVPQDAPVVADTLAVNVGLGSAAATDARELLGGLGAGPLADALGDAVLARDRKVSGGERQWIAVARAVATGLPVLLLDEPTSALDGEAQAALLQAIARLRGERTVLLVTHRPEPLAIADMVLRLAHRSDSTAIGGPASISTSSA